MANTYDYFWDLASLDSLKREKAAANLIKHLHQSYNEHKEANDNLIKLLNNHNKKSFIE
jgi:hypothetical protein